MSRYIISIFICLGVLIGELSAALPKHELIATFNSVESKIVAEQWVEIENTFDFPVSELYFSVSNYSASPNPFINVAANDYGYVGGFQGSEVDISLIQNERRENLRASFLDQSALPKIQKYSNKKNVFRVYLKERLKPGKKRRMRMLFTVNIPEVYSTYVSSERGRFKGVTWLRMGWYPAVVSRRGNEWLLDRWEPATHVMRRFELSVPTSSIVALPGRIVEREERGGRSRIISSDYSGISSFALGISNRFNIQETVTRHGIVIRFYTLPNSDHGNISRLMKEAVGALEYFTERWGHPRIKTLRVMHSPLSGLWGMASDQMIFLGDGILGNSDLGRGGFFNRIIDHTLAHEIAHQYSGVGHVVDFDSENVFSEGITEYMAAEYLESKHGLVGNLYNYDNDTFSNRIKAVFAEQFGVYPGYTYSDRAVRDYSKLYRDGWDESPVLAREYSNNHRFREKYYEKGLLLFRTMEEFSGASEMNGALKAYFKSSNKGDMSAPQRLERMLKDEDVDGVEEFFQKWVYEPGAIDFSVRSVFQGNPGSTLNNPDFQANGNKGQRVLATIEKEGDAPANVDLLATFKDGSQQRIQIKNAGAITPVEFYSTSPLVKLTIDPYNRVLETDKRNNSYGVGPDIYVFGNFDQLVRRRPSHRYQFGLYPVWRPKARLYSGEFGLGLALTGTDTLTHEWELGSTAHFAGGGYVSYQAFAGLDFFLPRDQSLRTEVVYDSRQFVESSFEWRVPLYRRVELGAYGNNRYPDVIATLGVSRFDFNLSEPVHAFRFSGAYTGIANTEVINGDVYFGPSISGINSEMFFRANMTGMRAFKFGQILVVPSALIGFGKGVPEELQFDLNSMRGVSYETLGSRLGVARLDLVSPLFYGDEGNINSYAIFRGLSAGLFAELGSVWDGNEFAAENLTTTVGVELGALFTTFADLRVAAAIGYAEKVAPNNNDYEIYFRFTSPTALHALAFGY